jgi:hypothetical protein
LSLFLEETIGESNNVVISPFAFHFAVQQLFKPFWSRLLLHDNKPSQASFAICFKPLPMSLLPAAGFSFYFPSPRRLSSSGSYPLELFGFGDPTGSNVTAGLALWVTGNHKAPHHGKVEIPVEGELAYTI